jgi:hypothetical protein
MQREGTLDLARRMRRWGLLCLAVLACGAVIAAVALAATSLTATPNSLTFAAHDVGVSPAPAMSTVIKNTDATPVTIQSVATDNSDFTVDPQAGDCDAASPTVLAQDETCTVHVLFTPVGTGTRTGTLTVASSGDDASVGLSGEGTTRGLTAAPTSLPFGSRNVSDGASAVMVSTITNTGSSDVAVGTPSIGGTDAGQFAFASPAAGSDCDSSDTLAPGEHCDVRVVFDPSTTGGKLAHVTVPSDAPDVTVGLSGTGTQPVLARNQDLSFGGRDIDDGATTSQTSVVQNTGDGPATISTVALGGTSPGDFVLDSTGAGDCKTNTVLAPNDTCDVRVAFDPITTGLKQAVVNVTSNAAPLSIAVDGTGEQTTISPDQSLLAFGGQDIDDGAATPDQTVTFTNSGPKTVAISGVTVSSGQGFTRNGGTCSAGTTSLAPAGSCTVTVRFDPATTGSKTGTASVTSPDAFTASADLSGSGEQTTVSPSPASFDFGGRDIDDGPVPSDKTFTFTNSGPKTLDIATVAVSSGMGFTRSGGTCVAGTTSLAPTESCTVVVQFDPSTTGAKTGTVTVAPTPAQAAAAVADLSGSGEQTTLSPSPTSFDFGSRDIDDGPVPSDKTFTFTNSGPKTLDINTVAVSSGQGFTRNGGTCSAGTTSLAPTASCTVIVQFDPSTTGAKTGTVIVTPNSGQADAATADLAGAGEQTTVDPNQGTLAFGGRDIDDGPVTPDQTATFTNSGPKTVSINAVSVSSGAGFTRNGGTCAAGTTTLTPTQSCTVTVRFDPSTVGSKTGTLTVSSPDAADSAVNLTGEGEQTTVDPDQGTLAFGGRDIDDGPVTPDQTATFTNSGPKTVSINAVSVSSGAGFTRNGGTCSAGTTTLTPTQSCTVTVRFDPSSTGPKTGTITVSSPDAADSVVNLTGTGEQTTITPDNGTLDFGSQDVSAGPTSTHTATITNSGPKTVNLSGVALVGSQRAQFTRLTDNPGTDCTASTVLAPSATCEVRVRFDPSYEGAKSATVSVTTPDADPVSIALVGSAGQASFPRSDVPLDSLEFDGPVNAVAFDSAGRTYVGGAFSSVGRRTGRAVKLTTTDDQPNAAFPDVDGPVNAIAADGSGGWFIGGSFATVGGTPRTNLAHILSNGAVDASWNPGADHAVNAIAVSGSFVYIGGDFRVLGGQPSDHLGRVSSTTGALSINWAPDPNLPVAALTFDGTNLYVGGDFTDIGGSARNRAARLATNGVADSWNPNVNGTVSAIAVSGTDVYLGGAFTQVGATTRNRIAKLAVADAAPDATWNPSANGTVNAIALDGSNVDVAGAFTNVGTQPRNRIARLSSSGTGSADGWDPNANGTVNGLAVTGSDVYAVGAFTNIGGQTRNRIARLSAATGLADTWNPNANATANTLAIAGTDIYIGGSFTSVGGQTARARIARLLPDGTVDPDWDPGSNNTVNALLVSGADVYVGGQFTSIGGLTRNRLARLTTADGGAADPSWNPDAGAAVNSLALSGTSLFVGGGFTTIGGGTHNRLAKISTTGSGAADATWAPSASGSVFALATDGTSVYAGGTFITVGAGPVGNRPFIAKLGAGGSGALDPDWNPSANSIVRALALSGSSLFVGGDFSSIGGQTRNRIAKLSATGVAGDTGNADLAWDPNANNTVRALTIAGNDIYAAGDFTLVGSVSHNNVVRLPTGDGGVHDSGWNPIANGSVNALAATNTRLAVGGAFTTVHSQSRQGVALFDLPRLWRDPSGQQFGSRDTGDGPTAARTTVVSNAGAGPITFSALTLTGSDAGEFSRLTGGANDCTASTTLAPGGTCNVRVQFDPSSTGLKAAWVDIEAANTPDATIGLAGSGTHTELTRSPTSLSFGGQDIDDGPAADQESTVTNSGSVPITLDSPATPADPGGVTITGTNAADFTRLTGEPTDCFDGRVLNGGQTCKVRLEFDPVTTGAKTATATVNTDSGNPTIALDGSGIQTQLTPSPSTVAFGKQDIDDSSTAAQFSTVTNSGTEPVTFTSMPKTGADAADFSPATFAAGDCTATTTLTAGQTCQLRYTFDPTTVGNKSATVTVNSNAPPISVSLTGEGTQTQLTPAPTSLSFGSKDIDDGATAAQSSTITNSGTEPVTISAVNVSGDFAQVSGAGTSCAAALILTAGQTCKVYVQFDPTAVHARSGTVTVVSNAPDATVALDGTGIQTELSRTPSTLPFGDKDIDEGATTAQDVTVTNSGTQSITLSALTIDGGDFAIVSGAGTNCTSSTTLTEGQSCKVYVQFDPAATGSQSQTLTIDSNEVPDLTVALTGRGTQTELSRSPDTLAFGGQDVDSGASAIKTSTVTNSGSEPVSISSVTLGGTNPGEFSRVSPAAGTDCTSTTVLTAGQTCDVRIQFDPSTQGAKSASVSVASNAATITVDLTGTGKQTKLDRTPTSLAFGSKDIDDGATAEQFATVKNVGTEDVTLGAVGIVGTDAGQFVRLTGATDDCSTTTTLAANETCKVRVQFNPSTVGAKSATARVSANGVDQDVTLSGTGIQTELSRSPDTLSFGSKDIDDGATPAQSSTVTNSGTEDVTITGVNVTGDFAQATGNLDDCFSGTTLLHAGDTCKVRVTFNPSATGARTGTATVQSNAADVSVALDGTGIQTELSRSPASLSFGSKDVDDGQTTAQDATILNSGTESVTLTGVELPAHFEQTTGAGTNCADGTALGAGASCKVYIAFNPSSVGAKSGNVTVHSNAADVSVAVDGTGIQTELSRTPATLSFGSKDIDEGATTAQTSTVRNTGTEPVTVSSVDVPANFVRSTGNADDCGANNPLAANATCTLRVAFDPSSTGAKSGSVVVHSNAADVSVAVDGNGIQTSASIAPTTLPFGSQDIDDGATAAQESTVTNTGTQDVHLSAVTLGGSNPGQFQRLTDQGTDCTSSTVLTGGQTCKVRVEFNPDTVGAKAATVTVTSDVPNLTVSLTGTGIQTELSRSPATLSFGSKDIDDGATPAQTATVTNSGSEAVTVSSVDVPAHFVRLTGNADDCGASNPLAANGTCKLRITFDPSSTGAKSGNVVVHSNAADVSVAVDGNGIQTSASIAPGTLSFGSQDIDDGATAAQEATVTNTGTETVSLSGVSLGGADPGQFNRLSGQGTDCTASTVLTAGQTCKVRIEFNPSATGAKTATVTVASNVPALTVSLTGTATQTELSRSPDTLSFGNKDIDEGATADQFSTVTNSGTEPVTVTGVSVTGDFAQVTGDSTDCVNGKTLNASQTCKVRVTFDPTATGGRTGTATVHSNAADVSFGVSGAGIQTGASVAPGTLTFGSRDIDDGPTSAQTSTVTNTGSQPVTLTGVNLSGADFERVTGAASDCANGTTLNAAQTCEVRVRFDPSSVGAKTGGVTVSSNAADVTIALDGSGIQTELTRTPDALGFGSRNVSAGATGPQELTLTNSGTQAITLSAVGISGTNANQFQRLSGDATDCGAGTALAGGATCTVRVRFTPTSAGAKTAAVTVASNVGGDLVTPLSGTGLPRPKLTIPAFQALASSTARKRLNVAVVPVGGTIRKIVVEVRSPGGALLGTGNLASASGRRTVVVHLKRRLPTGRYQARAHGTDAFGHRVNAKKRSFSLTARRPRQNTGGGGGSGGGGSGGGGGGGGGGGVP